MIKNNTTYLTVISTLFLLSISIFIGCGQANDEESEFTSIFNGKDFSQWRLPNNVEITDDSVIGYTIKDGIITSKTEKVSKRVKNIYTEKEYENYIFRFEFKLDNKANNGLGLRCSNDGSDVAYSNFELQILDNSAYKKLQPYRLHASIYGVLPAKTGALKPVGEWNSQEIYFNGTHLKVTLNGTIVMDSDLTLIKPHGKFAKGLLNARGHICLAGHGPGISFRNLRIKELKNNIAPKTQDNTPPTGFTALFDGKSFDNWKGLMELNKLDNPINRAKASKDDLEKAQKAADESAKAHWSIQDGAMVFDGKGYSLTSTKEYRDYEFYVDWKIENNGDSGIYLHGSPQVQIWDPNNQKALKHGADKGSGGLWNNKKSSKGRFPLVKADKPIGEWNTFFIRMVRGKVTVYLNNKLIVNNVQLDQFWDKGSNEPLEEGQIQLQAHGHKVWFKNIYIKELNPQLSAK